MPSFDRSPILINARVLAVPSNGQKRVAEEIINRLKGVELATPGASSASGLRGHLWEQAALPRLARRRRLWSPSTTGPVRHPNHIVTVHDIAFVDGPEWFSRSFATLYDLVVRELVKHSRHIITVSEFTRRRLIEHYRADPDRVTTVHSGSTPAFHRRDATVVGETLGRLGITTPNYLVGFLGNDPRKNTARVIEAWQAVSPRHPDARLVTFGRTSNSKVFAALQSHGADPTIIHVGPISDADLACLYSGAAGLAFPSLYEGFGLPVIEAAACGSRVVTAQTSALPEVSPSDAILVDPKSVAEITHAMAELLQSPDSQGARITRMKSVAKFTWENAATSYGRVFEEFFE